MKKNEKIISGLVIGMLLLSLIISIAADKEYYLLVFIAIIGAIFTYLVVKFDWIMCLIIVLLSLTSSFIIFNLGINSKVMLLLDYLIIILFIKAVIKLLKRKVKLNKVTILILLAIVLGGISLFLNPLNSNSINSMYYYVIRYSILAFGAYYSDISKDKVKLIIKIVSIFVILQTPVVLLQTKILNVVPGTRGIPVEGFVLQDFYSGLLGAKSTTELGFLIILNIVYLYYMFINKEYKLSKFIFISILSILTVVISEIKVVFVLVPLILVLLNLKKINLKSLGVIIVMILVLTSSFGYVGKLYQGQKGVFFDKQSTIEYINMDYAGSGISRVNGVFVATKVISNNLYSLLLGYGPGSGNKQVNGLYNFRTFFFPGVIYENGYLYFITLMIIYGLLLKYSISLTKEKELDIIILGNIGIALFIVIIFSGFYSNSMNNSSFSTIAWLLFILISRVKHSKKNNSTNKGKVSDVV